MGKQFDIGALLRFSDTAMLYCGGISDTVAREYAMEYVRVLQNRAKGMEAQGPQIPASLFEPSGYLIRFALERMYDRHLRPAAGSGSRLAAQLQRASS